MAEHLKNPAVVIAGINTVVTAAGLYYVYQQINGLRSTVAELERQVSSIRITIETIRQQDQVKAEIVKKTNKKIDEIAVNANQEITSLSSYIAAMNTDIQGLTEQLNSSSLGVHIELPSMASAMASYQGEMHFPQQYQQSHFQAQTQTQAQTYPSWNMSPGQQMTFPPGAAKGPAPNRMGMMGGPQGYHHPNQGQQLRSGPVSRQAPQTKPREPDPIGDLIDMAQNHEG